jgi:L-ascorbate metabolism protein UlaG (beta-lactamase superfamily)
MVYVLSILALIIITIIAIGMLISGPVYSGPVSDHFDGKHFYNEGGLKAKGLKDVLRWMISRKRGNWIQQAYTNSHTRPVARVQDSVKVTFINHTSFLIQGDGTNILLDPVFSERSSPFQFAGPKRMRPPGIRFADLPKIDVVILSHNHYDHLDLDTLRKLEAEHQPQYIVPLGVKALLTRHGFRRCVELDWWDSHDVGPLRVQSVPAQHFSGRGTLDRDRTLWCGYIISMNFGTIYFAGDTGYNPITFKKIGERIQNIDISIIPIGAYKPVWFMSPVHCSPEEAVKIHLDVRSKQSIASHFGTFPLADEAQEEPVRDLNIALTKHGLDATNFIALPEGESYTIVG